MRAVDDLRGLANPAHGQRNRTVQPFDLGVESLFQDADRLARNRAQPRHAVQHRSMQMLGQSRERSRRHVAVELQEQHCDCLGVFVGQDLADDLGFQPAQQAERRLAHFLFLGRNLTHQVFGLHFAHRAFQHTAYIVDAAMSGDALAFCRMREACNGIGNRTRFDFAHFHHGGGNLAQFVGRKLGQDARGIFFRQQHHHDGGLVGAQQRGHRRFGGERGIRLGDI